MNKVYTARWQKFALWRKAHSVSHLSPSPPQVANYLSDMFTNGARYTTVRGLLSATVHTLRLKPGRQSLGSNPVVLAIFPVMRRQDSQRQPSPRVGFGFGAE
jgi:hypothetical protein